MTTKIIGTKWKPEQATGLRYDSLIRRVNNEAYKESYLNQISMTMPRDFTTREERMKRKGDFTFIEKLALVLVPLTIIIAMI